MRSTGPDKGRISLLGLPVEDELIESASGDGMKINLTLPFDLLLSLSSRASQIIAIRVHTEANATPAVSDHHGTS